MPFNKQNKTTQEDDDWGGSIARGEVYDQSDADPMTQIPYDARAWTHTLKLQWPTADWVDDKNAVNTFAVVGRAANEDKDGRLSEYMTEAIVVPTDKIVGWEEFEGEEGKPTHVLKPIAVVLDPLDEPEVVGIVINANAVASKVVREFRALCTPQLQGRVVLGVKVIEYKNRRGDQRRWGFCRPSDLESVTEWTDDDEKGALRRAMEAALDSDFDASAIGNIRLQ